MRRFGVEEPYEKLKSLTRGREIDAASLREFVADLDIPESAKEALRALEPQHYVGTAEAQARAILEK